MAMARYYPGWSNRREELCEHLRQMYGAKGYETQVLEIQGKEDGTVFQLRDTYDADWKKTLSRLTGLDSAATVTMTAESDVLRVTVGSSSWAEKAAVAGVGYIAMPVLMVPAAYGAWKQKQLLDELEGVIRLYVENHGTSAGAE